MAKQQAEDEPERHAAEHRAEPLQHRHGDGADQVQRLTGRGGLGPGGTFRRGPRLGGGRCLVLGWR